MSELKNFVAVDWRAGKDQIYFFFKDTKTYSRFDIAENKIADGYPRSIDSDRWGDFHAHATHLRFGFTTTHIESSNSGPDILWLFYDSDGTPMVCKFDQNKDEVTGHYRLENSLWRSLLPYFYRIVAGTWWDVAAPKFMFRFLTDDGHTITFNSKTRHTTQTPTTSAAWPGLAPYKNRIITAAQNDAPLFDTYYYIFLTNNEYIRYNLKDNQAETGPTKINDGSWPGLSSN